MKIILVTPEYGREQGGVGRYLYDLYVGLPQERVLVIQDALKHHWIFAIPKLWWRLRKYPKALLHVSHVLPYGTVAMFLRLLTGRKYIVSLHGMDYFLAFERPRKRFLMRLVLRFATGVTTNTQTLANHVEAFSKREVFVLPPSLPRGLSTTFAERRSEGQLRILALARLVERKGFDTLIEALFHMQGATLTIAGDGPDRLRLERIAAESGFSDRIAFLGRVDDVAKEKLYREHDIFVLPTREIGADREGFGIVFLEAQYFGLPIVGGEGIGVHEAIHPKLRNFAVRHSAVSLASAMRDVMERSPNKDQLREFARGFDAKLQSHRFWKWSKHV